VAKPTPVLPRGFWVPDAYPGCAEAASHHWDSKDASFTCARWVLAQYDKPAETVTTHPSLAPPLP
jgi:hypothetical protein